MNPESPIQKGSRLEELLQKYHTSINISRNERETLINLLDKEIIEGHHDVEDKMIMVLLQSVLRVNLV